MVQPKAEAFSGLSAYQTAMPAAHVSDTSIAHPLAGEIEQSIPQRFEKLVQQFPQRIAVSSQGESLTFGELNFVANRLARRLIAERGAKPEPIGLLCEKGLGLIAAMMAVLKARKFFVLLDANSPAARLRSILMDAHALALIADRANIGLAQDIVTDRSGIISFEMTDSIAVSENLGVAIAPEAIACIFYTSGSTGEPKGVIQTHRNLLHYQLMRGERDGITERDRFAYLSAITSNAISHVFYAILNGITLLPYDVKKAGVGGLAQWLNVERVSICVIGAPLYRQFCEALRNDETFPHLRQLRLGSEAARPTDIELHRKHFPRSCVLATGLSTSETGGLTEYRIDVDDKTVCDEVPVGHPFRGKEILLLDDNGAVLPAGQIGEIVVRSDYLSPGYWRNPVLTASRFKQEAGAGGKRRYFTGDLGLLRPDGCLIHKGRKDFRVKIRGFSVDLLEVEKMLSRYPGLSEVVAAARQGDAESSRLVAYFTTAARPVPSASALRRFLAGQLPDYMIPSAFVHLQALPLMSGKVDRAALPDPSCIRPTLDSDYVAPRNRLEEELVATWQAVLDIQPVGVHDDFFELGGHSLLAARLVLRMQKDLRREIWLRDLIESPNVARLAARLARSESSNELDSTVSVATPPILLSPTSAKKAIFCFPYLGGWQDEFIHFCQVARYLESEYALYGLLAPEKEEYCCGNVNNLLEYFIEQITQQQPDGPYLLVGECLGGVLAYAVAERLTAMGKKVCLLMCLDTPPSFLRHSSWRRLRARVKRMPMPWALEYSLDRFRWHRDAMKGQPPLERVRYLFGKVFKAPTILVHGLHRTQVVAPAIPQVYRNGDQRNARTPRQFYSTLHNYVPHPYAGDLTLLVAAEGHDGDPTREWTRWVRGAIEVHRLPGDHDRCVPDNIPAIAQLLTESIKNAETRLSK